MNSLRNNYKVLMVFLVILFLTQSCSNSIDTTDLKSIYNTENVTANYNKTTLNISITNSKSINEAIKNGAGEEIYMLYNSSAALLIPGKKTNTNLDSVCLTINFDAKEYTNCYSIDDLVKIIDCNANMYHFNMAVINREYNTAKKYLAKSIIDTLDSAKLEVLLKQLSNNGTLINYNLLGFSINDDTASLLSAYNYDNGKTATFLFSFILDKSDKIEGISLLEN